jgi:predicted RNA-binding Zn-ribbon protein involved in translation (DUF1610 family)
MADDSVDVPARCRETTAPFTIQFEIRGDGWVATEATSADGSGNGVGDADAGRRIQGEFRSGPAYDGCPDCGELLFFRCGSCGHLGCYDDSDAVVCPWCEERTVIRGDIEELEGVGRDDDGGRPSKTDDVGGLSKR